MSEDIKYYYDIINSKWWYFDMLSGEWKEYEEESNDENIENNNKNNDNEMDTTEEYSDSINAQHSNINKYDENAENNNDLEKWKELNYSRSNKGNNNKYLRRDPELLNISESRKSTNSLNYDLEIADSKNHNKLYSSKNNTKHSNLENKLDDDELLNNYYENAEENNAGCNDVNNYVNSYINNNITNNDLNNYEYYYDNNTERNMNYYENDHEYNYDNIYNNVHCKVEPDTYENYKNNDYYNYEEGEYGNTYDCNNNKKNILNYSDKLNENKEELDSTSLHPPKVEQNEYSEISEENGNNNDSLLKIGNSDNTSASYDNEINNTQYIKNKRISISNDSICSNNSNELSERINSLLNHSNSNSSSSKKDSSALLEQLFSRSLTRSDHLNSFNTLEKDSDDGNHENKDDNKNNSETVKKKTKVNFQLNCEYKNKENEEKEEKEEKEKSEDNKELLENENDTKVIPFVRRATRTLTFKNQGGLSGCLKVFQEKKKELMSSSANEVNDTEIKIANLKMRARELARRYKTKNQSSESQEKSNEVKTKFEELVLQVQKHKKEIQEKNNDKNLLDT